MEQRRGRYSLRPEVRRALAPLLGLVMSAGACGEPTDGAVCDRIGCAFSSWEWARLAALAISGLGSPARDRSNAVAGDRAAVQLGQMFFSDARFSGTSTQVDALRQPAAVGRAPRGQATNLSCASCHDLGRGGGDTASVPGNVSSGAGWTDVNALGIVNCAYQRLYTWNGRADSLWAQAFAVAENPTTMNGNRLNTARVIAESYRTEYDALFSRFGAAQVLAGLPAGANGKPGNKAGCQPSDPTEPFHDAYDCLSPDDQEAVTRVQVNWAKALAAYEETLVSGEAPFDRFVREGPASDAIGAAARRGARLFVGKAGCVDCHDTPLLSDRDFHNVGVPQLGPDVPTEADCPHGSAACDCTTAKNCLPWGAYDGLVKLQASPMRRTSKWSDDPSDTSRAADVARTPTDALKGAWRTPSLRNVALTAPYMHDGVYATLEEVVAHYSRGPDPGAVGTPAVDIKPLFLSAGEQSDLVAFLHTLSATPQADGGGGGSAADGNAVDALDVDVAVAGTVPVIGLAMFDTTIEGFAIDQHDEPANLAVYNGGVAPTLSWDGTDGSPAPGCLEIAAPFSDYGQQLILRRDMTSPMDWAGQTLQARVKVRSAFNPDPAFPGVAELFCQTTLGFIFAGQATALAQTTDWQLLTFVLDSATVPGFDPRQVVGFGVKLSTGDGGQLPDGGAPSGKPTPAVFFIDSFARQ